MSKLKTLSALSLFLALSACSNLNVKNSTVAKHNSRTDLVNPIAVAETMACQPITEQQVASLFDRWNDSLKTLNANKVVANYANKSILLPTVSNKPRLTMAEKKDYFEHFLENKPTGQINQRAITFGCNTIVNSGTYTFAFGKNGAVVPARYTYSYGWDGKDWLITSHHSSAMPEK